MVRPGRFERPTFCSGGKRSIQLSYGRTLWGAFILYQCSKSGGPRHRSFEEPFRRIHKS
ncbi:hypothetical protein SBA4_2970021 [Candidatus Sulfopaludibacter sp. SbA4]|nr:hypothetical protein SBA4_2970021 [Candidatus Sulfopaludibacter sp. SbA4]